MTHDFLDEFQIRFVLAESCTERMPELMHTESWDDKRIAFLISGCFHLACVVVHHDSRDYSIHAMRAEHIPETILPDEPTNAIHNVLAKSIFLLLFV